MCPIISCPVLSCYCEDRLHRSSSGINCLTKSSRLALLVLAICHVSYNEPECILFCFLSNVMFYFYFSSIVWEVP